MRCENIYIQKISHRGAHLQEISRLSGKFQVSSYYSLGRAASPEKTKKISGQQAGSAASCPSMLFLKWRLSSVLNGNLFELISRRIQLFSQRCENIINHMIINKRCSGLAISWTGPDRH